MGGAVLHSPNTPSWRGAQGEHRDNFTLALPLYSNHNSYCPNNCVSINQVLEISDRQRSCINYFLIFNQSFLQPISFLYYVIS